MGINHLLRTVAPSQIYSTAYQYDNAIFATFSQLFGLSSFDDWNSSLHGVSFATVQLQARLPLRFGGFGLRNSIRTSATAYWASWADSLNILQSRFPEISQRIFHKISELSNIGRPLDYEPLCLVELAQATIRCDDAGWDSRPSWNQISDGIRPPVPEPDELSLGEWAHGWQYHANSRLEADAFQNLLCALGMPSKRRNARSAGKVRIHSCCGRFTSAWLTT